MTKKPSISSWQMIFMTVGSALVFPYTFMPILTAPPGNQDAWIVLLMSFFYILLLNSPILFLMNKFRGYNFNETIEMITGSFFGKLICFIYVLFFVYCFTACMMISAIFINLYILVETPTWAILLCMTIPICYAVFKGAGTIGRLSLYIVAFMIFSIIVFFLMGLNEMNIDILRPMLADSSLWDLNKGAFLTAARYSEILIFWVYSFYLKKEDNLNAAYRNALIIFGISFLLILIPTVTVLGVEFAKHCWNPYFMFTRQVDVYDFIERVQSVNTLAWFPAILLKLMMYNYMASFVLSKIFKAKSHKNFVIPVAFIGFCACLIPFMDKSSTIEFLRSDYVFPFVVLPVTFGLPLIILIVYLLRKKKIKEELKNRSSTL